jgi:hypothetical protein
MYPRTQCLGNPKTSHATTWVFLRSYLTQNLSFSVKQHVAHHMKIIWGASGQKKNVEDLISNNKFSLWPLFYVFFLFLRKTKKTN